jgi:hypothetical protein
MADGCQLCLSPVDVILEELVVEVREGCLVRELNPGDKEGRG